MQSLFWQEDGGVAPPLPEQAFVVRATRALRHTAFLRVTSELWYINKQAFSGLPYGGSVAILQHSCMSAQT